MFELLQEEGLTTKKEGGSTHALHGHIQRPRTSAVVTPEANCALVPSWEDSNTEHVTAEDCVRRRQINTNL